VSPKPDLARQITTAFVTGTFNTTGRIIPTGSGWAVLPEMVAAERLRNCGADDVAVRLRCTFTSAMDRARDARRLWKNAAEVFLRERWVFEPTEIRRRGYDALRETLRAAGVSQRHGPDSLAWLRIGQSLEHQTCAPYVYRAVYEGKGDTGALLSALTAKENGRSLFPFLKGPKVSLMWVRMLVYPGRADIADLEKLRVAVDVQVRKVTEYLGLTKTRDRPLNEDVRGTVQDAWQRNIEIGGGAWSLTRTLKSGQHRRSTRPCNLVCGELGVHNLRKAQTKAAHCGVLSRLHASA
jgi:hypothetical protein